MYDVGSPSTRGNEKTVAWIIAWLLYACSIGLGSYIKSFATIQNPLLRLLIQTLYTGSLGYVLIVVLTGYRSYVSKSTVYKSFAAFLPLWLYSLIACVIEVKQRSSCELSEDFFPLMNETFGTLTPYVLVALFGEYINLFVEKLEKALFEKLLLTMLMLWTIWPTFFGGDMYGQRIGLTTFAYLLGAYIAKYEESMRNMQNRFTTMAALLCAVLLIGTWLLNIVDGYVTVNVLALVNLTSPAVYLLAFVLVCLVTDEKVPKMIELCGMTCMGAFWIYGHPALHGSIKRFVFSFVLGHCVEALRMILCGMVKKLYTLRNAMR